MRIVACADTATSELSGFQVWYNDYDVVAGPIHGNMRDNTDCKSIDWSMDSQPFGSWLHTIEIATRTTTNPTTNKIVGMRVKTRDYSDESADDTVMEVGILSLSQVAITDTLKVQPFYLQAEKADGNEFYGFETTHTQL